MAYEKQDWKDGEEGDTPITAERLDHIEDGIADKSERGEQGEKGDPGKSGSDGKDGSDFTYDDFTEEQLDDLKGPKGDTGDAGKAGSDGSDGKNMTYEDMSDDNIDDLSSKVAEKLAANGDFVDDVAGAVDSGSGDE